MKPHAILIIALMAGCDQISSPTDPAAYQTAAERYRNDATAPPESSPDPVAPSRTEPVVPAAMVASPPLPQDELPSAGTPTRSELDELRRELSALRQQITQVRSQSTASSETMLTPEPPAHGNSSRQDSQSGSAHHRVHEILDETTSRFDEEDEADRLNDLVWEYRSKRDDFIASEKSYEIDALMSLVKAAELFVHDTPLTFNVLPERCRHHFGDLQAAARSLRPSLKRAIRRMDASDPDYAERMSLIDEVESVIDAETPGTGNRLLDLLEMFKRHSEERHQAPPSQ